MRSFWWMGLWACIVGCLFVAIAAAQEPVVVYSGPIRWETVPDEVKYLRPIRIQPNLTPAYPVPQRYQQMPARMVPAPIPFRTNAVANGLRECEYDPDHVCNRCGTAQFEIARWNRDGTHSHVCPNCRHSWRH